MASSSGKHTVYVDVDDEITAIIEKVKNSPDKIVALVLPKRATVLQSIVNMKLLKKSATNSKKSLVLITSEEGLIPLAGVVGLHVAKTLQSKPVIPLPPERAEANEAEIDESVPEDEADGVVDKSKPVGELAGLTAANKDDETETIELDDEPEADTPAAKGKGKGKKSRFKVPNFDKFRLSFFLGILGVILLITVWIFAAVVLPKATITIATDTTTVTSTVPFTASTEIQDLSLDQAQIPAVSKEVKRTDTEKTTASGKLDKGAKATGTMTLKNCEDSNSRSVPAGTIFATSGKNFVSNAAVTVPAGSFSGGGTVCNSTNATVGVTAQNSGDSYNVAAGNYTSSSSSLSGNFRLSGSAMTGGTTSVVTVVSQDDIDKAVATMKGRLDQEAFNEIDQQLKGEEMLGLAETRVTAAPIIKSTPALNEEASGEVTVTAETTYTELGIKRDYLSQLVKKDAGTKLDLSKQSISDDGLDTAAIRLATRTSPTVAQMTVQTVVTAGPEIDEAGIKDQIRGKKRGDAEKIIGSLPGVKDVTVQYSPFWVLSTPKSVKKITIVVEKPVTPQPAEEATGDE